MRGTEKAYVSGREVGMSMRTASGWTGSDQHDNPRAHSVGLTFFLVVRGLPFHTDKFVPFALSSLIQQSFGYPREEMGGVCCLLCAIVRTEASDPDCGR